MGARSGVTDGGAGQPASDRDRGHECPRRRPAGLLAAIVVLLAVPLAGLHGPAAEAQAHSVSVTRNVQIPVSSGNVLRGDLYVPVIDGEPVMGLPTIVTYFPYVKDDPSRFEVAAMRRFAEAGYAGLLVDIAGTGVSPGEFGFLDRREIADGRDVVEWAAAQPFSNGRVGMWGYSYPGVTAAHVAATRPPSLRAVVPASIFHDVYRDVVSPGGILTTQDGVLLPWIAGQALVRQRQNTDPALGLEAVVDSLTTPGGLLTVAEAPLHTTYDEYWQERALEDKIGNVEVPTLLWGGWADIYPRGTLLNHHDIGADHVRLVMGPWGHLAGAQGEPLELFLDESLRWFDTFLRRDASPAEAAAVAGGARVFDVDWGSEEAYAGVWPGRFVELPAWPPAVDELVLSLCADGGTPDPDSPWPLQGRLADDCAAPGSIPVVTVPVELTGGGSIGHDAVPHAMLNMLWDDKDQRLSPTSTAFLTEPFEEDVVLTGPMQLSLTATTLGVDTDWVVRVVEIGPSGNHVIAPGWLRASRRHEDPDRSYLWHTHDRTDLLTPGEPYELTVEIWPASHRVLAGHRLGLLVRAADTLKVTPPVGGLASTILTGPGTTSRLTVPLRRAVADPADPVEATTLTWDGDTTHRPTSSTEVAAVLRAADGGALAGRIVRFEVDDRVVESVTDDSGRAAATLELANGADHDVVAVFDGDATHLGSAASATIAWKPGPPPRRSPGPAEQFEPGATLAGQGSAAVASGALASVPTGASAAPWQGVAGWAGLLVALALVTRGVSRCRRREARR